VIRTILSILATSVVVISLSGAAITLAVWLLLNWNAEILAELLLKAFALTALTTSAGIGVVAGFIMFCMIFDE
jgi:hypothetical protein